MSFHEVRFPPRLSFGSVGGPERMTDIVQISNGFEERATPWRHSRRRYDAGVAMRGLDDLEELIAFFEARQGQLYAFRWKDWSDYKSCRPSETPAFDDVIIGTGDGATTDFRLSKLYQSGEHSYARPIHKPVDGSVLIGQQGDEFWEGQDYSLDLTTGVVSFVRAPDPDVLVTAGFEFDVPVRFDTSAIRVSVSSFQAGEIPDVPVVEVRV